MRTRCLAITGAFALALSLAAESEGGPVVFAASGANADAIQMTVDAFRAALGNPNNGNNPGPLGSGRREINWDGGGATTTSAAGASFAGFQNTRGALFTTGGTGFLQAVLTATPPNTDALSDIFSNPTYATTFSTFSPLRVFTPVDSNVTDATFSVPGAPGTPASISAFGAVFSDVDIANSTTIEFFGLGNTPLFSRSVLPGGTDDGSLSFLGVQFDPGVFVERVRITTGNSALGPNDGGGTDVVVMDDFFYAEPRAVPEPSTLALLAIGAAVTGFARRRRLP